MMKHLLTNQWRIMKNSFRTIPRQNMIAYIISFLVIGVMLFVVSYGIWQVAPWMDTNIVERAATFGFLIVIGMTILFGIPHVFKYLYAESDLEVLFAMPIPTRNIFWLKFLQNYIGVPLFSIALLLVPMLTYAVGSQVHFLFYLMIIPTLIAVTIIGLAIAYLVNLVIIQIIPASRANELMTVMGLILGLISGITVYFLFSLPNISGDGISAENIMNGLPVLPAWTPMAWAGKVISSAANGSWQFIGPLFLLLALTIVIMLITTLLVEKGFRTGYIRLNEGPRRKRKKRKPSKGKTTLQSPIIAVGKKEWLSIKRDIREWFTFLPVVIFLVFGGIGFFSGGGEFGDFRSYPEITWPIVQGILLFMSTLASGLTTAASIGREGHNLWITQILPLRGRQIAIGKLWISWLLAFLFIVVFEVIAFFVFKWNISQFIYGLLIQGVIMIGVSSIGLWLGTVGAKYHPSNPQARLNFGASILLVVASYIYLVIAILPIVYLFLPVHLFTIPAVDVTGFGTFIAHIFFTSLTWKLNYPIVMTIVGCLVFVIISGSLTALLVYLSARQMDKGITINIVDEANAKPFFGRKKSLGS